MEQPPSIAKAINKAIKWISNDTIWEGDRGYLYGRWCQTFVPATGSGIIALKEGIESGALTKANEEYAENLVNIYLRWLKSFCANECKCGEDLTSYHVGKPIADKPTIEHTSFVCLALNTVGESIGAERVVDVAAEKCLMPCVDMEAFDVYVDTAMPYYLLLQTINSMEGVV